MKYKLDFYTQYSQFYIGDKTFSDNTDSEDFWTQEAHNDRLALEDGIIGIGTECYGPVKAELEILDTVNNDIDYNLYDHVVEGGVEIKSGILQVLDCPISNISHKGIFI